MPIIKGVTSCYECFPKPTQKTYPICTIRSTPDKPVHCIVWAKELFKLIFGVTSESMLFEDEVASGDPSTYMSLLPFPSDISRESIVSYASNLLTALYDTEIQKRIAMDVYKTAKSVPKSIPPSIISAAAFRVMNFGMKGFEKVVGWDQKVNSEEDNVVEFFSCFIEVFHGDDRRDGLLGSLTFDKDDLWAMRFVNAASNLRSMVFSIPPLSFHDAKGIAGNIIPAIATTNVYDIISYYALYNILNRQLWREFK